MKKFEAYFLCKWFLKVFVKLLGSCSNKSFEENIEKNMLFCCLFICACPGLSWTSNRRISDITHENWVPVFEECLDSGIISVFDILATRLSKKHPTVSCLLGCLHYQAKTSGSSFVGLFFFWFLPVFVLNMPDYAH